MDLCASIVWRRLDVPGHEAAQLRRVVEGWELAGAAVFVESSMPCRLSYVISCDAEWRTTKCVVTGNAGVAPIALIIARDSHGRWTSDGVPLEQLEGCIDIDLGFSPSTNTLPIRRLALDVGSGAAVRAAWLRFPGLTLEVLDQSYTRTATDRYLYVSAGGAFRRELLVDESGFVLEYPGLWSVEGVQVSTRPR
jgi:uncharacterized protein